MSQMLAQIPAQRQSLSQTQSLVMTPQMKQAMHMLRCSALELNDYILELAADNPLTDVIPVDLPAAMTTSTLAGTTVRPSNPRTDASTVLERSAAAIPSLHDHLHWQVNESDAPPPVRRIIKRLIDNLDECGYLREDDDSLAAWLGVAKPLVVEAVTRLQSFDPPGIGARNLRECLHLQLRLVPEDLRWLVDALIQNHLDDVASGSFVRIARHMGVSIAEVQRAVDALRRLNPKPGVAIGGGNCLYVLPDLIAERIGNEVVVIPNEGAQPSLRINRTYLQLLHQTQSPEARTYLVRQFQAARWWMRCLEQRRMTLQRVAEEIVALQQPYFRFGPSALRPLTMRQVADNLGLHESTVSRAVRGKYLQTPFGVRALRAFFSAELGHTPARGGGVGADRVRDDRNGAVGRVYSRGSVDARGVADAWGMADARRVVGAGGVVDAGGIVGAQGEGAQWGAVGEVSAEAVKYRIREVIAAEDATAPLSDAAIAALLAHEGICVARRTVAKYREEMRIPASPQRRRWS